MFLHYSRTAIIHLHGCGGSSGLDTSTRKLAHELKKALQVASGRIISFHIINPDPAMLRLWPVSAPNLEKLVINTTAHFPIKFRGEMPLLRSIITPVMNDHQYLMAQNLTSLTLYPPYTLEKLLATLKYTPTLRRLELRRIFLSARRELPRVPLPYLEDLFLSSCFHEIINLLDFPVQTRITVSIPEYLQRRTPWTSMRLVSSAFIPPTFARSSTLTITTYETRGPTEIRVESLDTGDGRLCHAQVGFSEGSSADHRYGTSLLAMGMVHPITSVSNLRLDIQVWLPVKFMPWLKRFSKLKELSLNGYHAPLVLCDLELAGADAIPSLERVTVGRTFLPIYQELQDWVASQEQAGYEIAHDPTPVE